MQSTRINIFQSEQKIISTKNLYSNPKETKEKKKEDENSSFV